MIDTVSSRGMPGLSPRPAARQRATSSASWRSPPPRVRPVEAGGGPRPGDQGERGGGIEIAVDFDAGVGPHDRRPSRGPGRRGTGQDGLGAAVITEQHRGLAVHPGERQVDQRHDALRRAEDHRGERHRVDAQVQQGAPAQFGGEQPRRRVGGEPLAMVGTDRHDVAQDAVGQQPADLHHMGQEPGPHSLHEEQPLGPGGGHQVAGLGGVHGERLLYQHRFAGPQGQQRVGVVHRVGRGDVHHVDLGILDQRLVGIVTVGDVEGVGEVGCRVGPSGPDGHHPPRRGEGQVGGEGAGDPAGADDAPTQRFSHGRSPSVTADRTLDGRRPPAPRCNWRPGGGRRTAPRGRGG